MPLFGIKSSGPRLGDELERLRVNEADTSSVEFLHLVESQSLGKITLSLESALEYCEKFDVPLDQVMQEAAHHYLIEDTDQLIFSIRPSSVYLDEEVNNLVRQFIKEDREFCLSCNMGTEEARLITEVCADVERTGSFEALDALMEGIDGMGSGIAQGVGGTARNAGMGAISSIIRGAKAGVIDGAAQHVNNQMGRLLDTQDANGRTVRNGRIRNWFGPQGQNDGWKDFAGSVADGIRRDLSQNIVRNGQDLLGLGVDKLKGMSPRNMLDTITQRMNFFGRRIADGSYDPQKRNLFQRMLDKLKALRDKILAKIRGHA